jgi:RND family efflux transporter MFP subunit
MRMLAALVLLVALAASAFAQDAPAARRTADDRGTVFAAVAPVHEPAAPAIATFTVAAHTVSDQKAVFATVESRNVVPARSRIGGTVTSLRVKEGDEVAASDRIAIVVDQKLSLQMQALASRIAAQKAQRDQAQINLDRTQELRRSGVASQSQLDQAKTLFDVAERTLQAVRADRKVVEQQQAEGAVLAPIAGRVLTVPVTDGTVVLPGDTVAMVAEQHFVLRLLVPESYALHLKAGDTVRLDGQELGETGPAFGTITLIYPQIEAGEVRADASAPGIGQYFVGERIRVWVPAGKRQAIVIPSRFVFTRFGQDYVRLQRATGMAVDAPIQRGLPLPTPAMPDGLQILAGLSAGEILVQP